MRTEEEIQKKIYEINQAQAMFPTAINIEVGDIWKEALVWVLELDDKQ